MHNSKTCFIDKNGDENLLNFINSGFNHIHITPNPKVLDRLNKYGFIEVSFPYYGWLIAIMSAVIRTAANFQIPLIFMEKTVKLSMVAHQNQKICLFIQ